MQTIQDRNNEKQCQDEEGDKTEEPRGPTNIEAFNALEVAMEWVQRQDSVDRIQLMHLKRLRDMAVEKRMSSTEAENSKKFLFSIAMIFNVDCAMYITSVGRTQTH